MSKLRNVILAALLILTAAAPLYGAQGDKPQMAGDRRNDPAREEEFMDWGLGMFVHWSLDSQLGLSSATRWSMRHKNIWTVL